MPVDRAEDRIGALILKIGGFEPDADRGDRTGVRVPARHDDDDPPLPVLIRFRAPQRHAQSFAFEFQILSVQPDDLRTPEAARESEKNDCLVAQRTDVPAERFAKSDDVLGAKRASALLAHGEFAPDAIQGFGERWIGAVESYAESAMRCRDRC